MEVPPLPSFLWELFQQLQRRQFPLGIDDYRDLQRALRAGFGFQTREALEELCCALWANSRQEKETLKALLQAMFEKYAIAAWQLPAPEALTPAMPSRPAEAHPPSATQETPQQAPETPPTPPPSGKTSPPPQVGRVAESKLGFPEISLKGIDLPPSHFVFVPQYPLTYRQVAQAWRRLRQPIRQGPPVDLDIQATIRRRANRGTVTQAVLRPRRVNAARLLLLVSRQGSMTPFHGFIDEVCAAILDSANLKKVALYYFQDTPVQGTDEGILSALDDQLFPILDPILPQIPPSTEGLLYRDRDLQEAVEIETVFEDILTTGLQRAAVAIISDAGAARRQRDLLRLLDTIAFLKAVKRHTPRLVWLNPLPPAYWEGTQAAQIARHIPMLPLDRYGVHRAVNVLRGRPFTLERAL